MGIVRSHKGAIQVSSSPGRGSTFKLLFPACSAAPQRLNPPRPGSAGLKGIGTVLVADDEEGVLLIASVILQGLGFTVLTAADGSEALQVYRAHKDEIVCVLLDLTMPKMNGDEAFRRMRAVNPDVKVLLCSGYSEQRAIRRRASCGVHSKTISPGNACAETARDPGNAGIRRRNICWKRPL
jgi:CheY-like chemotaxis protein